MDDGDEVDDDTDSAGPARERLVLSLAHGPTLTDVVRGGPMPVREVIRIGTEVAALLTYLHDRDRPHGAVTPANILLGPGDGVQLAHVEVSATGEITDAGVGRQRPADDVHDLGAALITALTGGRGQTLPVDVPRTLRRVLLTATEIDPARRPTARQMTEMLAWTGRGEPSEPPEPPEPWWTTSGTAAWAFGGVALLIVLLAALGAMLMSRDGPITAAQPDASSTSSTGTVPATSSPPTSTAVTPTPTVPVPPPSLSDLPTVLPTPLPFDLPTTLPALPTTFPDLPDVPADAQGLWDRFVDWLRGLF